MTRRSPTAPALALALAVAATSLATGRGDCEPRWFKNAVAIAPPPAPSDAPAVVLYDRIDLRVAADLSAEIHQVQAIRILRSSGREHATFVITLEPGGKLKRFEVWSWDGHGRRSQAGRGEIVETTYLPGVYADTRRLLLRVPEVRPGDVVAAEYTIEEPLWFPSWNWLPQPDGLATASAEIGVELPRDWQLDVHAARARVRDETRDHRVREFVVGPLAAIPDEVRSPPWRDIEPSVRLRFLDPAGGKTFSDWRSVAAWYQSLAAPKYDPNTAPNELVERVSWDDASRAVMATAGEVQRSIHYAAIELGLQGWIPDAAADTWRRRYGDCKDKATLLIAALGAGGVTARPVLVCTRDAATVNPDTPDAAQFNHCIVAIDWPGGKAPTAVTTAGPSGKRWTFFDPTDPFTPIGMLPPADAGTWALIADSTEGLVRLPEAHEPILRTLTRLQIEGQQDLAGTLTLTASGAGATALVRDFDGASADQRRQRAADWLRSSASHPEIIAVRWAGFDTASLSASIDVNLRLAGGVRSADDRLVIRPLYVGARALVVPPDTTRTLPFETGGPVAYEDRYELRLPPEYRPDHLPAGAWSDSIGDYRISSEVSRPWLTLTRRLRLRAHEVPATRYATVRELLRLAHASDVAPILLRR